MTPWRGLLIAGTYDLGEAGLFVLDQVILSSESSFSTFGSILFPSSPNQKVEGVFDASGQMEVLPQLPQLTSFVVSATVTSSIFKNM